MSRFLILISFLFVTSQAFSQDAANTEKKNITRSTPSPDFPGEFVVDYGLNYFIDPSPEMRTRPWQSPTINIYYAYPFKLGESRFSFNPAIGLGIEGFAFKDPVTLIDSVGLTRMKALEDVPLYEDSDGLSFTKLNSTYVDIPLELRVHSRKNDHRRSWLLAVGFKAGFLINSGTKVKYTEFGARKVNKNRHHYNLNSLRFGPIARIGYGPITFWGHYRINKMFQGNKSANFENPGMFSFGISLATF